MTKKKRRGQQQRARGEAPAEQGPALSAEEQAARREQQKAEWAAQKRAQARAARSSAPIVWGGVAIGSLAAIVVLGFVLFAGGGGGSEATATPVATRDPRLGSGPIAKTVTVDADDNGQNVDLTFSVTTMTANAGDIVEVIVNNIGTVHHNLNFAGLDAKYGTQDDWVTDPQSIAPGETGKVLVKFDDPGTYLYHCDFHPEQQKGVLIVN